MIASLRSYNITRIRFPSPLTTAGLTKQTAPASLVAFWFTNRSRYLVTIYCFIDKLHTYVKKTILDWLLIIHHGLFLQFAWLATETRTNHEPKISSSNRYNIYRSGPFGVGKYSSQSHLNSSEQKQCWEWWSAGVYVCVWGWGGAMKRRQRLQPCRPRPWQSSS